MDGQAENPVPLTEVRDITEKRNEVRARKIIDGISQAHYIDDKISLFSKRVSPKDMHVSARVAQREGFKKAVQKLVSNYEESENRVDPLQNGTLSLNFTDDKMFALAGVGRHSSHEQPHPEPYAFTLYFSGRESLHSFLNWLTEEPDTAMTQVFERLMVRTGQEGKPFEEASYFADADADEKVKAEAAGKKIPYTERHPFVHNKIRAVNVKRDGFTRIDTITPPLGKPFIDNQHS